jgi:hypothetical protein
MFERFAKVGNGLSVKHETIPQIKKLHLLFFLVTKARLGLSKTQYLQK